MQQQPREVIVTDEPWDQHDEVIRANGWAVANAPRPLIGRVMWLSSFRYGIHYAAGPLDALAWLWFQDDAVLLIPTSPADIVAKARTLVAADGYDLTEIATEDPDLVCGAFEERRLPWDDEWMTLVLGGAL